MDFLENINKHVGLNKHVEWIFLFSQKFDITPIFKVQT